MPLKYPILKYSGWLCAFEEGGRDQWRQGQVFHISSENEVTKWRRKMPLGQMWYFQHFHPRATHVDIGVNDILV